MVSRFLGGLLSRKKKVEIKEGDEASIRKQIEEMIGPHLLEITNCLKDHRFESILDYVQYLVKTYTEDSLSEFHMYAPELVGFEYAERHGLKREEHGKQLQGIVQCFRDAVFDSENLEDLYDFEDVAELKETSWNDLWEDCGDALEDEANKEKYRDLNIEFSDNARTLGCFMAVVLMASLYW